MAESNEEVRQSHLPPHRSSRRRRHHGAAVARIAALFRGRHDPGERVPEAVRGVLFMGCGVNADHWWAKGRGAEMELSKTLEPLEPLKHKINVINGLFNKPATGVGIHPARPAICSRARRFRRARSSRRASASIR